MLQWFFANAFLLAVVLIGAAALLICGSLIKALGLPIEVERYAMAFAGIAALLAAFILSRKLHELIDRKLFNIARDKARNRA
jgi:uncharacterized membrane protein